MTGQQKDWVKRFVEMGEASNFIVDYLLDVKIEDKGQSNADYGAQARALNDLKEKCRQRLNDMKIQAR